MIKLRHASAETGCTILGKAEFMNPGGSVKDRAGPVHHRAMPMERGALQPGGLIVEGTAGNTGIGLALVANALGFRTVIVIPDTQARKRRTCCACSARNSIEVPAVPYSNPNNYVKLSGRLAERLAKEDPQGAIWANQFDNVANRQGAYRDDRPRDLGSRPKARSTASSAPSAPAARSPASPWR